MKKTDPATRPLALDPAPPRIASIARDAERDAIAARAHADDAARAHLVGDVDAARDAVELTAAAAARAFDRLRAAERAADREPFAVAALCRVMDSCLSSARSCAAAARALRDVAEQIGNAPALDDANRHRAHALALARLIS